MSEPPPPPDPKRIAEILGETVNDESRAAAELLPLVYDELRRVARSQLAQGQRGQTLQATALVHEAWLRVVGESDPGWECRAHFFGAAARAMRNILVEQYRRKGRLKRDGKRVGLRDTEGPLIEIDQKLDDLLMLEEALTKLEAKDALKARIVMLRFFTGLTMPAVAETLGLPLTRIEREWRFTRAWLAREVEGFVPDREG